MRNGDEASPSIYLAGQAFNENAQNSLTAWCILKKKIVCSHINSVVNIIVILPLALKRFIFQEEISPFSQNYFKIC